MKSPLKSKPLRNPGESLDSQIQSIIAEDVMSYFWLAGTFVVIAVVEWIRWLLGSKPSPWLYSIIAVGGAALASHKFYRARTKIRSLRLGRDGEKAVGQFLDELRSTGAQVFHDVPAQGFNIDHVLVTTSGLYAIETKTWSKPDKGEAKLLFDGDHIIKLGLKADRNPVDQARACARWLAEQVAESTGRKFPVKAVVLFPGWFIKNTGRARESDVWALNPKALPAFMEYAPDRLAPEDVKLCAYHLKRFIRAQGQEG